MLKYDSKLKPISRKLRCNSTDAERKLWSKIRNNQVAGLRFTRQKPIGKYIVDFYCHKLKLVIELDGSQHFYEESIQYDKAREKYLEDQQLKILRIANIEIFKNLDGVIEKLWIIAEKHKKPSQPPFINGGNKEN